ncbi:MAG: hypothetical protein ACI3VK_02910 [Oscillospiraceae bacterium]
MFLNNAAVGAAIGRPPVKIRSDLKQSASAKEITSIVTGRADAKAFNKMQQRQEKSASAKTTNTIVTGRAGAITTTAFFNAAENRKYFFGNTMAEVFLCLFVKRLLC